MADTDQRRLEYMPLDELVPALLNPKSHSQDGIGASVDRFGFVEVPTVDERTGRLVAGHGRRDDLLARQAAGKPPPEGVAVLPDGRWAVPVLRGWASANDDEARAYLLASNRLVEAGGWEAQQLADVLQQLQAGAGLVGTGFADDDLARLLAELAPPPEPERPSMGALREQFVVPPFTVLDARQGYWQDRKRAWLALGIRSELGREPEATGVVRANVDADAPASLPAKLLGSKAAPGGGGGVWLNRGDNGYGMDPHYAGSYGAGTPGEGATGTSIFDPVLCELAYRWFSPPGGHVLDPFAGGSVRGVVAGLLGRHYTGVDLRADQVAANEVQGRQMCSGEGIEGPALMPAWHVGDSRQLDELVPEATADLVFTCPPYYDLEQYSDNPADLNNAGTYAEFLAGLQAALRPALARLADDRFCVLVVGDVRGKDGRLRGLVGDTITAVGFEGLALYNDAVLVTAVGSLPVRSAGPFRGSRKLGRSHQAVLVFVKGSPERAAAACGEISLPSEITV